MDIIAALREKEDLASILYDICDVDILPEFKSTQGNDSPCEYSIPGKTFAKDGSGGEYVLLEDDTVGYLGSEGESGRIAESISGFFEFMVNCPFWMDYRRKEPYEKGSDALREFARKLFEEHAEMAEEDLDIELGEAQKTLAEALGIKLGSEITAAVLMQFYRSGTRSPRLITAYTEKDGTKHSNTGSLFV